MYLKNGLAEIKDGEREGGNEGGRNGGKERENSEYNGKGKKMRRNTFLSPCLSRSAAKQSRPTKEKSQCFSKSILKSALSSKCKKLQSETTNITTLIGLKNNDH